MLWRTCMGCLFIAKAESLFKDKLAGLHHIFCCTCCLEWPALAKVGQSRPESLTCPIHSAWNNNCFEILNPSCCEKLVLCHLTGLSISWVLYWWVLTRLESLFHESDIFWSRLVGLTLFGSYEDEGIKNRYQVLNKK